MFFLFSFTVVTQTVALRLVCHGSRAVAFSALQPRQNKSLIPLLTQTATLHSCGLPDLPDGQHDASYEGRGACRDVYRVGEGLVLKLCKIEVDERLQCNQNEAAALLATQLLPQTPLLYFDGFCVVEGSGQSDAGSDSVTLLVRCLLVSYGGPSFDKLMHKYFAFPYDRTVAEFFVAAYHQLAMMVIDGAQQNIAYADLLTANVSTLSDPSQHVPGQPIQIVIVDPEGVLPGRRRRLVVNICCEDMLNDFQLRCSQAQHHSWHFLGHAVASLFGNCFRQGPNETLDDLRGNYFQNFRQLWRALR